MYIYNVTVKLTHNIHEAWVNWMQEEHLNDLVNTGLFTETRLCKLLDQDDEEGVTYVAQYFCKTLNDYNLYIEQFAPIMRERGFAKFGNQFIAFRTLMEIVC